MADDPPQNTESPDDAGFFDENFEMEALADSQQEDDALDPVLDLANAENRREAGDASEASLIAVGSDRGTGSESASLPTLEDWEDEEDLFDVNPASILESMLFVGNSDNRSFLAKEMAALMRGVSEEDVDRLVTELNAAYSQQQAPYQIVEEKGGYRMDLRPEFEPTRQKFYRAEKPAQLSQGVLDVLSLVAYLQPVSKAVVESKKLKPCGSMLRQLIRRRLIQMERVKDTNEKTNTLYRTTERFLELFGLDSLDDLPKSETFESPG